MMNLKTRIDALNAADTLQLEAKKNLTYTINNVLRSIDYPVTVTLKISGSSRVGCVIGGGNTTIEHAALNCPTPADLKLEELIALGEYLASEEFNAVLYDAKHEIERTTGQILTVAAKLQTQNAAKES